MIADFAGFANVRRMTPEEATTLALDAIAHMVGEDGLLAVFCGASGLDPIDLRDRLDDPDLLAAALDFLLLDDAWVRGFASAAGCPPERVTAARAALPGGGVPHWT